MNFLKYSFLTTFFYFAANANCGLEDNIYAVDVVKMQDYITCNLTELKNAEFLLLSEMKRLADLNDNITNSKEAIAPYKAALALVRIQKLIVTTNSK